MRKKLRLTESELVGLVKKVIEEQTVSEQVEEMDEQSQIPSFTPQMNQLYDFIKKNSISVGALFKVMEYMKSSKPAPPKQQQPAQKAATQTTPQKTQQPATKKDYTVVDGKKYYSSGAVR
jgi:hypothetical protein